MNKNNIEERYMRSIPALSESELLKLRSSSIAVIGCGGLGGYVIEYLARLGVGTIICVDGDVFAESNLNRQLLSHSGNIGEFKVKAAAERVKLINPEVAVVPVGEYFCKENADEILKGADIVIDALDSVKARLELENATSDRNLFFIHGAIDGWSLQFMIVPPKEKLLHKLYGFEGREKGDTVEKPEKNKTERVIPSLPMTAAACAAFQVTAAVEVLCGIENIPKGRFFTMSMKDADVDSIDFS